MRAAGRFGATRWLLRSLFELNDPRLELEAFGLHFKNPVGLAAGYDKNGVAAAGLSALGFGHLEIGTVTRLPQAGNPRPRVHRFPAAQALVNSMGFPNAGIEALPPSLREPFAAQPGPAARRHASASTSGKGRDTPLEQAIDDYGALLRLVHARRQADYVAINVSSPNTQGLRQLQGRTALGGIIVGVGRGA